METLLAPLDLQGDKNMWKPSVTPPPSTAKSMRLPSLYALTVSATVTSSITIATSERSPRVVTMSDLLSSELAPLQEMGIGRLPSIHAMINRDASPDDLKFVRIHNVDISKHLQAIKPTSPRQPELEIISLSADTTVNQRKDQQVLRTVLNYEKGDKCKRLGNAKLCGMTKCNKRAKAGGFCIAHGGGLRCSDVNCTKHAVSLGLCISHGGGKRCTVEGCLNASRKNGVCWSHGGKRLCKLEGCTKGPKSGGYCWSHGGRMRK